MKLPTTLTIVSLLCTGCDARPGESRLATIHCQEAVLKDAEMDAYASFQRWQTGEYRYCESLNMPDKSRGAELYCHLAQRQALGQPYDNGKTFTVRFQGNLAYDDQKGEGAVNYWRCQRINDADTPFVCTK